VSDYERLWSPHRMAYIRGEGKPADGTEGQCPFCAAWASPDDEAHLVVARGQTCFVVLNLYPYNSGHLLVLPKRHISGYTALTLEETTELAQMTQRAIAALGIEYGPEGYNVGMNLGEVAGAGIASHLHQHVVPRWLGDANFLPIVGRTKAMPEMLADTRSRLAGAWNRA
jgi:ATP adenylyltransferase